MVADQSAGLGLDSRLTQTDLKCPMHARVFALAQLASSCESTVGELKVDVDG